MSAVLTFDGGKLAAISASLRSDGTNNAAFFGDRGRVEIHAPLYRPGELTLTRFDPTGQSADPPAPGIGTRLKSNATVRTLLQRVARIMPGLAGGGKRISIGFRGNGYNYQAEEVMRCLRAGLTESSVMPLDETLTVMHVIDAIRTCVAEGSK
jgi:hypothetical protein